MKTNLEVAAEAIKAMTYDELMELASSISDWSTVEDNGEELDDPVVSKERAAACLSDWADSNLPEEVK